MSRFEWVADSAKLLRQTGDDFERTRPFGGLRVGTGIHLEPKTAALLLTLRRGGAEVVSTGNLDSTQQATVDYLRDDGIEVIGGPTADPVEHDRFLRGVLATKPDLLLDDATPRGLDRIDGPRLHVAGPLPRGHRAWRGAGDRVRGPGPGRDRCARGVVVRGARTRRLIADSVRRIEQAPKGL